MKENGGKLAMLLLVAVAAFAAFQCFDLEVTAGEDDTAGPNFPPGGPAEFLYLDADRVAAYLAQVNGGTFDAEKVIRKLSNSQNAKLAFSGTGEAGASQSRETSIEREVQPTDASNFFSLRAGLIEADELHEVGLRYFDKEVAHLHQGAFVTFKTTALLSPQYLNAYLAVREDHTIAALFPAAPEQRKTAKAFAEIVGQEPRVVFALQPREAAGSEIQTTPFAYLLPMKAGRLTAERSLLKYGGGRFTVVGKVVRIFPEKNKDHVPAYIDSATRETWEQPLRGAPRELLCRTDPRCIVRVRERGLTGKKRRQAGEAARRRALEALGEQTQTQGRGAVILPVAIYK